MLDNILLHIAKNAILAKFDLGVLVDSTALSHKYP